MTEELKASNERYLAARREYTAKTLATMHRRMNNMDSEILSLSMQHCDGEAHPALKAATKAMRRARRELFKAGEAAGV